MHLDFVSVSGYRLSLCLCKSVVILAESKEKRAKISPLSRRASFNLGFIWKWKKANRNQRGFQKICHTSLAIALMKPVALLPQCLYRKDKNLWSMPVSLPRRVSVNKFKHNFRSPCLSVSSSFSHFFFLSFLGFTSPFPVHFFSWL